MASLTLKISLPEKNAVKTMQFDPSTLVYEACHQITEKIVEVNQGLGSGESSFGATLADASRLTSVKDYGLFLADEDPRKGVWLEAGRSLEYYLLRNGVSGCMCIGWQEWRSIARGGRRTRSPVIRAYIHVS